MKAIDYYKSHEFLQSVSDKHMQEVIQKADEYVLYNWPAILASDYFVFRHTGDRAAYQTKFYEKRTALGWLSVAYLLTEDSKYLIPIVNGLMSICDEVTWVIPAHSQMYPGYERDIYYGRDKIFIDLFSAETGSLLSQVIYLHHNAIECIEPQVIDRVQDCIRARIIVPYIEHDEYWWMGLSDEYVGDHHLNNWNPWCNGNCLMTLLCSDSAMEEKEQGVQKCIASIQAYIHNQPNDGCCDEGSSYWAHAIGPLYLIAKLLEEFTQGEVMLLQNKKVQSLIEYIEKAQINDLYFLPFADCDIYNAKLEESIIYSFGVELNNAQLKNLGKCIRNAKSGALTPEPWFPINLLLNRLSLENELQRVSAVDNTEKCTWFEDTEVLCVRKSSKMNEGLFLSVKGNHNDESHNHNDVGNYVVYLNGLPCIIDVGVEIYTKKTFSKERYDIWTMQSNYHNLPIVNGYGQCHGKQYRSKHVEFEDGLFSKRLSMDISEAYPQAAGLLYWNRMWHYNDNEGRIVLREDFELNKETKNIEFVFMCIMPIEQREDGVVVLRNSANDSLYLQYPKLMFDVVVEEIKIDDLRLSLSLPPEIYRLRLISKLPIRKDAIEFVINTKSEK